MSMDVHVKTSHESAEEEEEVNFVCQKCRHEFKEVSNYNNHLKEHNKKASKGKLHKKTKSQNVSETETK
jgi:hypothetical protein